MKNHIYFLSFSLLLLLASLVSIPGCSLVVTDGFVISTTSSTTTSKSSEISATNLSQHLTNITNSSGSLIPSTTTNNNISTSGAGDSRDMSSDVDRQMDDSFKPSDSMVFPSYFFPLPPDSEEQPDTDELLTDIDVLATSSFGTKDTDLLPSNLFETVPGASEVEGTILSVIELDGQDGSSSDVTNDPVIMSNVSEPVVNVSDSRKPTVNVINFDLYVPNSTPTIDNLAVMTSGDSQAVADNSDLALDLTDATAEDSSSSLLQSATRASDLRDSVLNESVLEDQAHQQLLVSSEDRLVITSPTVQPVTRTSGSVGTKDTTILDWGVSTLLNDTDNYSVHTVKPVAPPTDTTGQRDPITTSTDFQEEVIGIYDSNSYTRSDLRDHIDLSADFDQQAVLSNTSGSEITSTNSGQIVSNSSDSKNSVSVPPSFGQNVDNTMLFHTKTFQKVNVPFDSNEVLVNFTNVEYQIDTASNLNDPVTISQASDATYQKVDALSDSNEVLVNFTNVEYQIDMASNLNDPVTISQASDATYQKVDALSDSNEVSVNFTNIEYQIDKPPNPDDPVVIAEVTDDTYVVTSTDSSDSAEGFKAFTQAVTDTTVPSRFETNFFPGPSQQVVNPDTAEMVPTSSDQGNAGWPYPQEEVGSRQSPTTTPEPDSDKSVEVSEDDISRASLAVSARFDGVVRAAIVAPRRRQKDRRNKGRIIDGKYRDIA